MKNKIAILLTLTALLSACGSLKKSTVPEPTVTTGVMFSWPNSFSTRTAWRLMASMLRSSGVFMSSASPP